MNEAGSSSSGGGGGSSTNLNSPRRRLNQPSLDGLPTTPSTRSDISNRDSNGPVNIMDGMGLSTAASDVGGALSDFGAYDPTAATDASALTRESSRLLAKASSSPNLSRSSSHTPRARNHSNINSNSNGPSPSTPKRGTSRERSSIQRSSMLPPAHPWARSRRSASSAKSPPSERRHPRQPQNKHSFQNASDAMSVQVRTVDVANRTAFERVYPIAAADLQTIISASTKHQQLHETNSHGAMSDTGSVASVATSATNTINISSAKRKRERKFSPSINHCEVLERLYGVSHVRQLAWSSSVSVETDPFTGWGDSSDEETATAPNTENNANANANVNTSTSRQHSRTGSNSSVSSRLRKKKLLAKRKREIARDGRYQPIDPIATTLSFLPKHAPELTHTKRRLPMRADVGFPNPTELEINTKQQEIQREAELEEASPRLVVMITSHDVAVDVATASVSSQQDGDVAEAHIRKLWNQGGLDGMPLAGKELVAACYRNQKLYQHDRGEQQKQKQKKNGDSTREEKKHFIPKPRPNRASVFAPPIDASFSSTLGWRPRPFSDRPAGMVHILASPIDVRFDVGDIEPLVCTLSLYSLNNKQHSNTFCGKISEDFTFPAGDWRGFLNEKAGKMLSGLVDNVSGRDDADTKSEDHSSGSGEQSWRKRKRKAVFSYDPLALLPHDNNSDRNSREEPEVIRRSLYIVLQIHRASQVDGNTPYMSDGKLSARGIPEFESYSGDAITLTVPGSAKKKTIRGRIKNKLGMRKGDGYDGLLPAEEATEARDKAMRAFEADGTQFLEPLGFGVLPVFPGSNKADDEEISVGETSSVESENMQFPNGAVQSMQLYAYPSFPQTEEQFVERLISLAADESSNPIIVVENGTDFISSESSVSSFDLTSQGPSSTHNIDIQDEASIQSSVSFSASLKESRTGDSSTNGYPEEKKNTPSSRIRFTRSKTPKKRTQKDTNIGNIPIAGSAQFFTADMGVDFTQVMLHMPSPLSPSDSADISGVPRLLVDVSGDCAIMINPDHKSVNISGGRTARKRSDLVRLPPSPEPSGYANSSEVREILYLPPREEKLYDSDVPITSNSFLNLLYLYPRQIRIKSDNEQRKLTRLGTKPFAPFSVRVRLVQQSIDIIEDTGQMRTIYTPMKSLHNPAPWDGRPLLDAFYTKLSARSGGGDGATVIGDGIPLRDEVKLRLPLVLDGSHFIEFAILGVKFDKDDMPMTKPDGGLIMEVLAETMIPLSTSSAREKISRSRVTTVIPNGQHRIKIGEYQLNMETRLASSIHVSDPAVATVLRDFPFSPDSNGLMDANKSPSGNMRLSSRSLHSVLPNSLSRDIIPFHQILSNASEQAIVNHFRGLVFMHLCNLVNSGAPVLDFDHLSKVFTHAPSGQEYAALSDNTMILSQSESTSLMLENFRSLFEVLRKAKSKFLSRYGSNAESRMLIFFKDFVDGFDESNVSPQHREVVSAQNSGTELSQGSKPLHSSMSSNSLEFAGSEKSGSSPQPMQEDSLNNLAIAALEDKLLEAAVRVVVQQELANVLTSTAVDTKSPRQQLNFSGGPFSRRAYEASKIDRMRAEAEMYEEGIRFTEMFDDDETVMTDDTWRRREKEYPTINDSGDIPGNEGLGFNHDRKNQWGITDDESKFEELTQTTAFDSVRSNIVKDPSTPFSIASERAKSMAKSFGENHIAKRVNTVAQVMIAPCVGQNLSGALTSGAGDLHSTSVGGNSMIDTFDEIGVGSSVVEDDADFTVNAIYEKTSDGKGLRDFFKVFSAPCTGALKDDHNGVPQSPLYVCCNISEQEKQQNFMTKNNIRIHLQEILPHETSYDKSLDRDRRHRENSGPKKEKHSAICRPGSDIEEEGRDSRSRKLFGLSHVDSEEDTRLRHLPRSLASGQLESSLHNAFGSDLSINESKKQTPPFLYESILALGIQSWLYHIELSNHRKENENNRRVNNVSFISFLNYDPSLPQNDTAHSFTLHLDVLLPLCMKSLALRCSMLKPSTSEVYMTVLDGKHMDILEAFIDVSCRGLMGQALAGEGSDDEALVWALGTSESVLDFLVGLLAIIHPSQVAVLVMKYFQILSDQEASDIPRSNPGSFVWTQLSLRRARCSRQLRLRAVEKLSQLPAFVALNYPLKYVSDGDSKQASHSSWKTQTASSNDIQIKSFLESCPYPDGKERLPPTHWLADLLTHECLSICSHSCEAVVAEAIAQIRASEQDESSKDGKASSFRKRPGLSLTRDDLLRFQSTAVHAITCVYELLLRQHSMDARYQTEECRSRIASIFASSILVKSVRSVKWLTRMESSHRARTQWLLCFAYILQEAPESVIRDQLRAFCSYPEFSIHKFIRLLRLSSSTFQCFMDERKCSDSSSPILQDLSPWIVQESFNTICAATNTLVDECPGLLSSHPHEQKRLAQGVLDLLLHVIATPQSSVTHLRALGGASQALDKFGACMFLEVAGDSLQHWARMILTLMNSTSLSVRSISVDFFVSLLGGCFDERGDVDEIALVLLTVMPEVVAREIALYSVSGQISTMANVECSLWPLRRALADVEDANPLDDNRVDPQLSPFLISFCRTCQAVIDGVLIELRLMGEQCVVVGARVEQESAESKPSYSFDADEESLYEAANFFVPETAPLQRLRWLMTLKSLHESKGQWLEAAETLILCANAIADSILHVKNVWRPSRFILWHDSRRSQWLSLVGEGQGRPDCGNTQVMEFADRFLEPSNLLGMVPKKTSTGKLQHPSIAVMCKMLTSVTKEAVLNYLREDGMESLAFSRLERLLKSVMEVIEMRSVSRSSTWTGRGRGSRPNRHRFVEENAAFRKMSASLNGDMTRLAERMLLLAEEEPIDNLNNANISNSTVTRRRKQFYVRVALFGRKPSRFMESTTIPTFLKWERSSICRVPQKLVIATETANSDDDVSAAFGGQIRDSLSKNLPKASLLIRQEIPTEDELQRDGGEKTFIVVNLVHMDVSTLLSRRTDYKLDDSSVIESKRFFFRKRSAPVRPGFPFVEPSGFVELTVAQVFPCALSRQGTLITSEFISPPLS